MKGTALTSIQLNATSSVPGYFSYTPALKTVLESGVQTLNVNFEPRDLASYTLGSKTISINVIDPTGFNSIFTNDEMVKVYPLSTGHTKIVFAAESNQKISIYSLIGQQMYYKNFNGKELEVFLPQGAYIVNVRNEYGNFNQKVIIRK